jgi:hypothetical protein
MLKTEAIGESREPYHVRISEDFRMPAHDDGAIDSWNAMRELVADPEIQVH